MIEDVRVEETEFDKLFKKIEKAHNGDGEPDLPMGLPKLERYFSIRKNML